MVWTDHSIEIYLALLSRINLPRELAPPRRSTDVCWGKSGSGAPHEAGKNRAEPVYACRSGPVLAWPGAQNAKLRFAPGVSQKRSKPELCLHPGIIHRMPEVDFSDLCRSYHARLS